MLALIYVVRFVLLAIAAIAILWMVWPPLAGAFVGFLYWREFWR